MWFDGTDDEVVITHSPSISFSVPPEAMTIEFWFKRGGARSGTYDLLGKRSGCGGLNYNLSIEYSSHDALSFATTVSGSWVVYFAPLTTPDTVWNHAAVTADGTEIRMYLNGEVAWAGPGVVSTELSDPLKLGQSGNCSDDFRLIGWLDEVRFWNVARTAEEIHDSYNRSMDPGTPGLVGYWTFDESVSDQTVRDLSPTGNSGTLGVNDQPAPDDPTRVPSTVPLVCADVPCPFMASDVNCDGVSDVLDVVLSINTAFRGAIIPSPCCSRW
jgi:hypothetical protein